MTHQREKEDDRKGGGGIGRAPLRPGRFVSASLPALLSCMPKTGSSDRFPHTLSQTKPSTRTQIRRSLCFSSPLLLHESTRWSFLHGYSFLKNTFVEANSQMMTRRNRDLRLASWSAKAEIPPRSKCLSHAFLLPGGTSSLLGPLSMAKAAGMLPMKRGVQLRSWIKTPRRKLCAKG